VLLRAVLKLFSLAVAGDTCLYTQRL